MIDRQVQGDSAVHAARRPCHFEHGVRRGLRTTTTTTAAATCAVQHAEEKQCHCGHETAAREALTSAACCPIREKGREDQECLTVRQSWSHQERLRHEHHIRSVANHHNEGVTRRPSRWNRRRRNGASRGSGRAAARERHVAVESVRRRNLQVVGGRLPCRNCCRSGAVAARRAVRPGGRSKRIIGPGSRKQGSVRAARRVVGDAHGCSGRAGGCRREGDTDRAIRVRCESGTASGACAGLREVAAVRSRNSNAGDGQWSCTRVSQGDALCGACGRDELTREGKRGGGKRNRGRNACAGECNCLRTALQGIGNSDGASADSSGRRRESHADIAARRRCESGLTHWTIVGLGEIARAKKKNTALNLATLHLDDFGDLRQRFGGAAVDEALREFARRLKEVSRGSDYAVRLGSEDFVLVLPKCNVGEVSQVSNSMGSLELNCSGKKISLTYTTGWVDYQPGDMPSDLLKRASQLLHLYDNAAKNPYAATGMSK